VLKYLYNSSNCFSLRGDLKLTNFNELHLYEHEYLTPVVTILRLFFILWRHTECTVKYTNGKWNVKSIQFYLGIRLFRNTYERYTDIPKEWFRLDHFQGYIRNRKSEKDHAVATRRRTRRQTIDDKIAVFQRNELARCIYSHEITNLRKLCSNPAHCEVHLMQHYVIKFISGLRQDGGFLRVFRFHPPIKLTATI